MMPENSSTIITTSDILLFVLQLAESDPCFILILILPQILDMIDPGVSQVSIVHHLRQQEMANWRERESSIWSKHTVFS